MNDDDIKYQIPRRLDEVPKFLFWDVDIAIVAIIGAYIGIWVGHFAYGLGFGIVMATIYSRTKSGHHPGFALHFMYWHLPSDNFFKRTPPSHIREFFG